MKIMHAGFIFAIVLSTLVMGAGLPEPIRLQVEAQFPESDITGVETEQDDGIPITAVELRTVDGKSFEMRFSSTGELLSVEQESSGLPWIGGSLSLGVAARIEQEPYRGSSTETEFTPFILYENGPFEILSYDNLSASYEFLRSGPWSFDLSLTYEPGAGYDADDSDYLDGMDELDELYYAGVQAGYALGEFDFGISVDFDISGEHDGYEIEVMGQYSFDWISMTFRPKVSLTWVSQEAMDYFYGVSETESRPDRPAYAPGSDVEIEAELLVLKPVSEHWTAVGLFGAETFGREARDSPLMDGSYELECAIGLMYIF